jgi:beta-xylosidase
MSLPAGTELGRYEIRSKIGEGGIEEVYRAYSAKTNRFVSAALRSVLSLLLVGCAIPFRAAASTEFAANRSQALALSASHFENAGSLLGHSRPRSGNPIITGWYADPEAHIFKNEYWVYPTYSAKYDEQVFFDAFSSKDLITWKKHPRIFANVDAPWVKRALWAPSVVEKGGWYYLFFGANDIQNDQQLGGIGIARSRQPGGPFKDYLGKPLIDKFHNGAQPIDQFVFKDTSLSYYIIYGGWRHCNIAKLNDDFTGLVPFADGTMFKEITPKGYVEGAFMFVKDGKYYFMWSEGGWTGPDYAVAYAVGSSVFGPFERVGKILQQNPSVATGAGHHSVLHRPGSSRWYIVYHRRPLGETDRNHRVVCIDEMRFDEQGLIQPVVITNEGVPRDALP